MFLNAQIMLWVVLHTRNAGIGLGLRGDNDQKQMLRFSQVMNCSPHE